MLENMTNKNLGLLYSKLNWIWANGKLDEIQEKLVHYIAQEFELRGYDIPDFCNKLTKQDIKKLQKRYF